MLNAKPNFASIKMTYTNLEMHLSYQTSAVEWVFGDIHVVNYLKFLDFKKNLKIGVSAVGKMYIDCALVQNTHTILYQSVLWYQSSTPRWLFYLII